MAAGTSATDRCGTFIALHLGLSFVERVKAPFGASTGCCIVRAYILVDLFVRGQSECAVTFTRTESEKGRGISKMIRESFDEKERRHALPIDKSV
jgi:hypothetical protein